MPSGGEEFLSSPDPLDTRLPPFSRLFLSLLLLCPVSLPPISAPGMGMNPCRKRTSGSSSIPLHSLRRDAASRDTEREREDEAKDKEKGGREGGRTSERIYLDSRHRVPPSISSEVGDEEEDETRNVVIWFINTFHAAVYSLPMPQS